MSTINDILTRRSVREFIDKDIDEKDIETIINAGIYAPSGLNNQPWKFIVVKNKETKEKISNLTKYGRIIRDAPVIISVFLDKNKMYDFTKDVLSIGACIQNMLLAVHSLGLGSVWLGEILKNKEKVNKILQAPENFELMAIVAIGYPVKKERKSERNPLSEVVYFEKFRR